MTHIYPVHAHRGSETETEGSDLAPVSDVEMDVDENDQDYDPNDSVHDSKIGGKIKSELPFQKIQEKCYKVYLTCMGFTSVLMVLKFISKNTLKISQAMSVHLLRKIQSRKG